MIWLAAHHLVFRALNHNSWSRRNSSSSLDTSLISASLFSVPSTLLWRWNGIMQCTKEQPQLLQRSCKKSRGCLCIMSCAMKHLSGRRWSCASGSFIIMTTELCRCAREHQINGDSVITNTMHLIKFLYKHSFIFIILCNGHWNRQTARWRSHYKHNQISETSIYQSIS